MGSGLLQNFYQGRQAAGFPVLKNTEISPDLKCHLESALFKISILYVLTSSKVEQKALFSVVGWCEGQPYRPSVTPEHYPNIKPFLGKEET